MVDVKTIQIIIWTLYCVEAVWKHSKRLQTPKDLVIQFLVILEYALCDVCCFSVVVCSFGNEAISSHITWIVKRKKCCTNFKQLSTFSTQDINKSNCARASANSYSSDFIAKCNVCWRKMNIEALNLSGKCIHYEPARKLCVWVNNERRKKKSWTIGSSAS